jgi:hypothetical protein
MNAWRVMGLDVGPPGEPTGFAIIESPALAAPPREYEYHLRHIERFPPGTPYTEIVRLVADRVNLAGFNSSPIAVDLTAVGPAFMACCWKARAGLNVQAHSVTAGLAVQKAEDRTILVPKRDLVMALQLALQGRRLKIAPELPQANLLTVELASFRMRSVPMSDMAAIEWRQGCHDDLVFAVALAVWFAEKHPPFWPGSIRSGGRLRFPNGTFHTDEMPSFRKLLRGGAWW